MKSIFGRRRGNDSIKMKEGDVPQHVSTIALNKDFFLNHLKQYETIHSIKLYFTKYLSLITINTILLVIPATRSRASWLAIIASTVYIAINILPVKATIHKYLATKLKKFLFGTGIILLGIGFIFGTYYFKKDSADGRLLIWKVSSEMIKDKPVFGFGYEKFQADYMDYQAAYFEKDPDSEESYVADDISYPFNDYVKLGVEAGFIGLCLLGTAIFFIFSRGRKEETNLNSLVLKAGIMGLIVFAFFSYPAEILPVMLTLTILLALLAGENKIVLLKDLLPELPGQWIKNYLVRSFSVVLFVLIIAMYFPFKRLYAAYFLWDEGYKIYQMNAYEECLESFEESYDVLKNNGEYLIMYGKALSMAERHGRAIEVLQQAKKFQKNTILYTAMGDSYKELGKVVLAERAYMKAVSMIPSRFYGMYLLAKLYEDTEQCEKAMIMAKEILSKEEKIPSTAIEEMKEEMKEMLEKQD